MINTALITPRNFIVIGLMAVAAHILIAPLLRVVQGSKE